MTSLSSRNVLHMFTAKGILSSQTQKVVDLTDKLLSLWFKSQTVSVTFL